MSKESSLSQFNKEHFSFITHNMVYPTTKGISDFMKYNWKSHTRYQIAFSQSLYFSNHCFTLMLPNIKILFYIENKVLSLLTLLFKFYTFYILQLNGFNLLLRKTAHQFEPPYFRI